MAKKGSEERMEQERLKADLERQIEAGTKEQTDKLQAGKEHLLGQLSMAAEKYRTVNGYMQARQTIDQVRFGANPFNENLDAVARDVATRMSGVAKILAEKLEATDIMELDDSLLDGLLDADFIDSDKAIDETAFQLLIVQLLQNVGPAIDEAVSFREGSNAGLATLREELASVGKKKATLTVHDGGAAAN